MQKKTIGYLGLTILTFGILGIFFGTFIIPWILEINQAEHDLYSRLNLRLNQSQSFTVYVSILTSLVGLTVIIFTRKIADSVAHLRKPLDDEIVDKNYYLRIQKPLIVLVSTLPLMLYSIDVLNGLNYILYYHLADDAFYYFEISRHIPYFNEGIPNSGFHPLFTLIIAPFHRIFSAATAIQLSLLTVVIFQSINVVLVFKLTREFFPSPVPLLSATTWAGSSLLHSYTLIGTETSLAVCFVLSFFLFFVRYRNDDTPLPGRKGALILGFLGAVSFWARMDSPLILIPAFLYLTYRLFRNRSLKSIFYLYLFPVLLPGSWLVYIKVKVGSFFPTSGSANRILSGLSGKSFPAFIDLFKQIWVLTRNITRYFYFSGVPISYPLFTFLLFTVLLTLAHFKNSSHQDRRFIQFFWVILIGFLILISYYLFYQGRFRKWYFLYLPIVLYGLFVPLFFEAIYKLSRSRLTPTVICLGLMVFPVTAGGHRADYKFVYDKYRAGQAAETILKNEHRPKKVGSLNAGVYDYVTTFDVINLDGVVNPLAARAIKEGTLDEYVKQENIGYLIEHPSAFNINHLKKQDAISLTKWINLGGYYGQFEDSHIDPPHLWKINYRTTAPDKEVQQRE